MSHSKKPGPYSELRRTFPSWPLGPTPVTPAGHGFLVPPLLSQKAAVLNHSVICEARLGWEIEVDVPGIRIGRSLPEIPSRL